MPRSQKQGAGGEGYEAAAARPFGAARRRSKPGSAAAPVLIVFALLAAAPSVAVLEETTPGARMAEVAATAEVAGVAGGEALSAHGVVSSSRDPTEAVMVAAGRWVLERLPSGAAGLDPHRSGAGKDGARVKRVAAALGMELTTLDQAKQCRDVLEPSTCQLGAARLLAIGAPRIQGDAAEVKIYAWYRSDSEEAPVAEKTWDLSLRRSGGGWVVTSGG